MAVSVVKCLEIVEIEKAEGSRLSVAVSPSDLHCEFDYKNAWNVKLGEIIDKY